MMRNILHRKQNTEDPETLPVRLARFAIRFIDQLADWFLLCLLLLMIVFGIYSIWDTRQVYQAASPTVLATYKPDTKPYVSFQKLHKMNPDVIGWVQVYGTNIDYPVAQGSDNEKYLNTDAQGEFSLSGCPFLDSANAKDFSDSNSIIYGHHMDKDMMFGDLDQFRKKKVFKTHKYGDLYFDGRHHGLQIFAFIEGDAYDSSIYNTEVGSGGITEYYGYLKSASKFSRSVRIDEKCHIVLLSTCAGGLTNKRYIVAAKLTNHTFKDSFAKTESAREGLPFWMTLPWWWYVIVLVAILVFLLRFILKRVRKKNKAITDSHENGGV